ncbi:MAG TPA: 5'-nucleotidase, lipoprotein e(P4) family [Flavobacterium sp.]|nr:5'-nucleotidase, lipoprotein e(P4) family [Flavobacterium sp.]
MKKISYFILLLIVTFSCTPQEKNEPVSEKSFDSDHLLMATLWFQNSAEAKAMFLQTYKYATYSLDKQLETNKSTNKKAIVFDIDETLLDNSPYEAYLIEHSELYNPDSWFKWEQNKSAKALPGAVEFVNYAVSKGVEIFYVSNRKIASYDATVENLVNVGFPMVDKDHVYLREEESSKESRRQAIIAKGYDILMLVGDNLSDFSDAFELEKCENRNDVVDSLQSLLGERFIMLPNPMYGDWEKEIFGGSYQISDTTKFEMLKDALISF